MMFDAPTTVDDHSTTSEYLRAHNTVEGWGLSSMNTTPETSVRNVLQKRAGTTQEAYEVAARTYASSFNTKKRIAITSPHNTPAAEGAPQAASKRMVLEMREGVWQDSTNEEKKQAAQILIQHTRGSGDDQVVVDATNPTQTNVGQMVGLNSPQEQLFKLARAMGCDIDTTEEGVAGRNLANFLNTPINTIGDVVKLMTSFHTEVTQQELKAHALNVEALLDIYGDKIVSMHKELEWLSKESRNFQKQRASCQVILSGWPDNCDPGERESQTRWMMRKSQGVTDVLLQWWNYDTQKNPELICWALQVPPTTIVFNKGSKKERYAAITVLTFVNFQARQGFLNTYMTYSPQFTWKDGTETKAKIRTAPSSPDFQRQLEVPLRTVHRLLNTKFDKMQFVTLWKSLTVMYPQHKAAYDEDHKAIFKLEYVAHPTTGDVIANIHCTTELAQYMNLKAPPPSQDTQSLWQKCWTGQITGRENEINDTIGAANITVEQEGKGPTGKHWSAEFTKYSNTNFPFKIKLIVYAEDDDIEFDWKEYQHKMQKFQDKNSDWKDTRGQNTGAVNNKSDWWNTAGGTEPARGSASNEAHSSAAAGAAAAKADADQAQVAAIAAAAQAQALAAAAAQTAAAAEAAQAAFRAQAPTMEVSSHVPEKANGAHPPGKGPGTSPWNRGPDAGKGTGTGNLDL
jgi:hypothetical protein